jgi:hypothetical protein
MFIGGGKIIKFAKNNPHFRNFFPRVMEALKGKSKRLKIDDGEGCLVD